MSAEGWLSALFEPYRSHTFMIEALATLTGRQSCFSSLSRSVP